MKHLVDYYDEYMSAHLINNNSQGKKHEDPKNSQIKLLDWVKNKTYVAMALTNYTIQVNFFLTHFKVIIQGQFDSENKVPWLPTSPLGRKTNNCDDLNVISMADSDITQPFKIIFINNKRMSYELNPAVVLPLLRYGPQKFAKMWLGSQNQSNIHSSQDGSTWSTQSQYNQSQYGTPEHQSSYNPNAPHNQSPNCQYNSPMHPDHNAIALANKSFQQSIGANLEELYGTLARAHLAMHQLTVFSNNCYYESALCQACHGNTEDHHHRTKMNPNCLPQEAVLDLNGSPMVAGNTNSTLLNSSHYGMPGNGQGHQQILPPNHGRGSSNKPLASAVQSLALSPHNTNSNNYHNQNCPTHHTPSSHIQSHGHQHQSQNYATGTHGKGQTASSQPLNSLKSGQNQPNINKAPRTALANMGKENSNVGHRAIH